MIRGYFWMFCGGLFAAAALSFIITAEVAHNRGEQIKKLTTDLETLQAKSALHDEVLTQYIFAKEATKNVYTGHKKVYDSVTDDVCLPANLCELWDAYTAKAGAAVGAFDTLPAVAE